jgi:molecular chaperone HscB
MDPFAVFGLAVAHDLDPRALETRYIELSRACHPDHHAQADADAQVAMLTRAADVNEAYRVLRDPWRRAEAMLAQRAPGLLASCKTLAPAFLMDAMELAEQVAEARGDHAAASALHARIEVLVAADLAAVGSALASSDWPSAATRLHQSRYHRKALHDLSS